MTDSTQHPMMMLPIPMACGVMIIEHMGHFQIVSGLNPAEAAAILEGALAEIHRQIAPSSAPAPTAPESATSLPEPEFVQEPEADERSTAGPTDLAIPAPEAG